MLVDNEQREDFVFYKIPAECTSLSTSGIKISIKTERKWPTFKKFDFHFISCENVSQETSRYHFLPKHRVFKDRGGGKKWEEFKKKHICWEYWTVKDIIEANVL